MTDIEIRDRARQIIGAKCACCPECNGLACGNRIPGPGSKAPGNGAHRNWQAWRDVTVNLDCIAPNGTPDTALRLFGRQFAYPLFAAPIGSLDLHYVPGQDICDYNDVLIPACAEEGVAAFYGDGLTPEVLPRALAQSRKAGGAGVPVLNPWPQDVLLRSTELVNEAGVFALSIVVDSSGLPFLKNYPGAGSKSVSDLREIVAAAQMPVIIKGVMTARGAEKAVEAGAAAVYVCNHGGRVLGGTPGTAEVLPEIVRAVGGQAKILVDGGIRSGVDVFKALAMGADAALICRPFAVQYYGGGAQAVRQYIRRIGEELRDTMAMCGARTLDAITADMVNLPR